MARFQVSPISQWVFDIVPSGKNIKQWWLMKQKWDKTTKDQEALLLIWISMLVYQIIIDTNWNRLKGSFDKEPLKTTYGPLNMDTIN